MDSAAPPPSKQELPPLGEDVLWETGVVSQVGPSPEIRCGDEVLRFSYRVVYKVQGQKSIMQVGDKVEFLRQYQRDKNGQDHFMGKAWKVRLAKEGAAVTRSAAEVVSTPIDTDTQDCRQGDRAQAEAESEQPLDGPPPLMPELESGDEGQGPAELPPKGGPTPCVPVPEKSKRLTARGRGWRRQTDYEMSKLLRQQARQRAAELAAKPQPPQVDQLPLPTPAADTDYDLAVRSAALQAAVQQQAQVVARAQVGLARAYLAAQTLGQMRRASALGPSPFANCGTVAPTLPQACSVQAFVPCAVPMAVLPSVVP